MKKSLVLLPLVLLVTALALAACGGGGSSSGGSDAEASIEEAVEESATSTDPSKCTELQTQAFDEQETAAKGKEAVENCESEAENNETDANSVKVSSVNVDGKKATVSTAVSGTSLNGQELEIELVEEGGKWKLNKFLGFAKYDSQALAKSLEEAISKEEGVSASLSKCVAEGVSKFSQAEAEEVAFEGKTEGLEEIVTACSEEEGK